MTLSKLAYFLLTVLVVTGLGLCLNYFLNQAPEPDAAPTTEQAAPALSKPKVQPPVTVVPAKPVSVVSGEDSALIIEAKQTLRLPAVRERTSAWQALVDRAQLLELVRLTEIPAQPTLDEGRTQLRYLAVQKIGQQGKMADLIALREKLDKAAFSRVQFMAWEEWGKVAPALAVAAWSARFQRLEPNANELGKWTLAFTKGLAAGNLIEAAAAIQKLPERERGILETALSQPVPAQN